MPQTHVRFRVWISCLTLLSGFINVVSLRSVSLPLSHHTGNISKIAMFFASGNSPGVLPIGFAVLSFFLGAFCSGLVFHQREFKLKKCYGMLLIGISITFIIMYCIGASAILQIGILSFVAGMQNAMFIYYKEIVVRTTHITGYLTDAAFMLAMIVRGKKDRVHAFSFYILNIFLFFIGGIIASSIKGAFFFLTLAVAYFMLGLYYFVLRKKFAGQDL